MGRCTRRRAADVHGLARRRQRRAVRACHCEPARRLTDDQSMPALRVAALLIALLAQPAFAHGISDVDSGSLWSYDPWLLAPLYAIGIGFYVGTQRLWRHAGGGRGVSFRQVAAFWTGWLVTALATTSPLHWLGEHLFTAHMVEHELLMVVAAPLLVLARPGGAMMWALPARWRGPIGGIGRTRWVSATWRFLPHPPLATVLHPRAPWAPP